MDLEKVVKSVLLFSLISGAIYLGVSSSKNRGQKREVDYGNSKTTNYSSDKLSNLREAGM